MEGGKVAVHCSCIPSWRCLCDTAVPGTGVTHAFKHPARACHHWPLFLTAPSRSVLAHPSHSFPTFSRC